MIVKKELCAGCGLCIPYCPVGAITLFDGKAVIDQEKCVECGTCGRRRVVKCPAGALVEREDVKAYPRSIRKYFSDPTATHVETRVPGRGTEEVKTNDVTGRVGKKQYGIGIEMGRPCLSASYRDVEKMTKALAKFHIQYEEKNPIKSLFQDEEQGLLKKEALEQSVVSAIIEFTIEKDLLKPVLETILKTGESLDTVFSLDLIVCFEEPYQLPEVPVLKEMDLVPRPNNKINLGMGRPLKEG